MIAAAGIPEGFHEVTPGRVATGDTRADPLPPRAMSDLSPYSGIETWCLVCVLTYSGLACEGHLFLWPFLHQIPEAAWIGNR